MVRRKDTVSFLFIIYAAITLTGSAIGQTQKKPTKPPQKNETKGQGQLAGGNGQFGVIYTLQDKLNFEILSAKYTLEPFNSYDLTVVDVDQKLLVLDIAVKNATPNDYFVNNDGMFT